MFWALLCFSSLARAGAAPVGTRGFSASYLNSSGNCWVNCRELRELFARDAQHIRLDFVFLLAFVCFCIGVLSAFLFERLVGSPLPRDLRRECLLCCFNWIPCLVRRCLSEESLLVTSSAVSRLQRREAADAELDREERKRRQKKSSGFEADGEEVREVGEVCLYDSDEPRERGEDEVSGSRDGVRLGVGETCLADVTVHAF